MGGGGGGGVWVQNFHRGQTRVYVFIENAYFMDLISSQRKHELTTTTEAGYKTSIHQSVMFSCSFVEENQQSLGCTSNFRGLYATKHPFFSNGKQPHKVFVYSMQNMVF